MSGESLTILGFHGTTGDWILCCGSFPNEHIQLPGGNTMTCVATIGIVPDETDQLLKISLNSDTSINASPIVVVDHSITLCDSRFELFKSKIVIITEIQIGEYIRFVDELSNPVSPVIRVGDFAPMKSFNEFAPINDHRIIYMESFTDSAKCASLPIELGVTSGTSSELICYIIPRKSSLLDIRNFSSSQRGILVRIPEYPFPVITDTCRLVGTCKKSSIPTIRDVHYYIADHPADAIICSDGFNFYHYNIDGYNDVGWGCAYRSIQTMASWFSEEYVVSIEQMQMVLKRIDFAHADLEVGAKKWIGCIEASEIMGDVSHGRITCRILHAHDLNDLENFIRDEVWNHLFGVGSPVMVGAGNYAFTIIGVSKGENKVLIADPHYIRSGSCWEKGGGCRWQNIRSFFDFSRTKGAFVNICLPKLE